MDAAVLKQLQDPVPLNSTIEDYEIELEVPNTGSGIPRNARQAIDRASPDTAMLIGVGELNDSHDFRNQNNAAVRQHETLLVEVHHRIANSLQVIANILSLKAIKAQSQESRLNLQDASNRLLLIAAIQQQLCASGLVDEIEFGPYLNRLCERLASPMVSENQPVTIISSSSRGTIKSDDAANLGMIATELVINALKHGFPNGHKGGRLPVAASLGP